MTVAVLVAAVITAARSQPDDRLASEAQTPKMKVAAAPRFGGTTCVGWPLSLTPTQAPGPSAKGVLLWGTRDEFHVRNKTSAAVVVDVVATGGKLAMSDDSRPSNEQPTGDDRLRLEVGSGFEVGFKATCSTKALTLSGTSGDGTPLGTDAFALGDGPADAPLEIAKQVRR